MSHPRRAPEVRALVSRLTGFTPVISYHLSSGDYALLPSAAAAWGAADPQATHHVVFQDDVVPHRRLHDLITRSITLKPMAGIAAFCEWGCKTANVVRLAAVAGCGFAEVVDKYVPTNALVLPAAAAIDLSGRLAKAAGEGAEPDDTIVKEFADDAGLPCFVTVPNLTEDLALPSLVGNAGMGERKSACFLSDESSWPAPSSQTLGGVRVLPFFQWATGRALVLRRAGAGDEWSRDDLAPLLAESGLGPERIWRMTSEATANAGRGIAAATPWLPELTQVTAALVLCAAGLSPGLAVTGRLSHQVARCAWRSLIPGGLRCLAPVCARTDIADDLFAFTAAIAGQTEELLRDGTLAPLDCAAVS